MEITRQNALQNITDLVAVLMCGPKQFDMSTIEPAVCTVMIETGLRFRDYMTVLAENIEGYKQSPHETVEEYFFDAINTMNITEGKIGLFVKLCIA